MTGSLFAASQRTVAPFRYDIVGSFLRSDALKEARKRFAQGRITQRELRQVEDAKIAQLVAKPKALGLRAVTDGEYRRNWWHLDFLWNLDGVRKVAAEQGSIAFKKRQTKAETIEIVSKVGFSGHPFIEDFKAVQTFAGDSPAKFTIPSPSMLHLITAVRNQQYKPLERYIYIYRERERERERETMTRFLRTSPPPIRRPSRPFTRRDADICNSTIPAGGNSARRKKEPGISPAVSTWIASNGIMCP